LGSDGDFYFDTQSSDVYLKSAGTCTLVANLRGAEGPQGPQGPPGPSDVIFWGSFAGDSAQVLQTGGSATLVSFVRVGPGVYRIELGYPRQLGDDLAIFASGRPGEAAETYACAVMVFANQVFDSPGDNVVIEVVTMLLFNDPISGLRLLNDDARFSVIVLDQSEGG
jgi:hypothetical protein